jgi:hypothetical protein
MNIQELTTWNRLLTLDFDAASAALPFSARLARDNGWSHTFAARAIEEYRKFCFLAVHAGHPVTPSDEVDQVWHLHLTHSRHYWDALCRDTLERPLHHGPTQGGVAEDRKFHDWYDHTLAAYRRYFGRPPTDLWPAGRERFDERNDFVRINRRDVVTMDRGLLKRGALATLAGGGVLAVAHAVAQADGAAEASPEFGFVLVLAAALVGVFVVAVARSRRRKSGGAAGRLRPSTRRASDGAVAAGGVGAGSSSSRKGGGDVNDNSDGSSGCGSSGCGSSGCGGGGGGGG